MRIRSSRPSLCCSLIMNCFPSSTSSEQRKPGGWKSMPYIIGNETFEKLAAIGLQANFMVYLLTQFHLDQAFATNVLYIWSGTTNIAPLTGAFVSDAYLGKFRTIAFASVVSLLGMVALTLTAMVPDLRPPQCTVQQHQNLCISPSTGQLYFLYMALGFLTIGAAGIRSCSLPFGVDQFDSTTEDGRKGINSFFNWYYFTFTVVVMLSLTIIVYIQNNISWAWGLAFPTGLMLFSIILFFFGTRLYVCVPPGGSIFSSIARVVVAAYKKRNLTLPFKEELDQQVLYDPPLSESTIVGSKLPLTNQFRFLSKAAIVLDGEVNPDGSPSNPWRLCSIQQVEELKCLIRIIPIWVSGVICFTSMAQQDTTTLLQALKMDRHLGPKFKIPPGSLGVITMLTLGIWIPIYDRILVPILQRLTKQEGGITILQRMGIGIVLAILSMVVAGFVEEKRRSSAISHARPDGVAAMPVLWLAPQLVLMGLTVAFNSIGQIEFFNKQFPEHMRSIGNSLFFCSMAGGSYLSSALVAIVHKHTGKHGRPDWLDNNINIGRVDYFYFVLACLGVFNLVYFMICASRYHYKASGISVIGGNEEHEQN